MHEAGLATALADALRREGVPPADARVRLLVTGGHAHAEDFDGALRLHLSVAAPEYAVTPIEIVHLPIERTCVSCRGTFAAPSPEDPCPACGGSSLPLPTPEHLEIEVLRPDVSDS